MNQRIIFALKNILKPLSHKQQYVWNVWFLHSFRLPTPDGSSVCKYSLKGTGSRDRIQI